MKTGFVQSSFIVNASRFDASYHLSGGVQSRALVLKSPYGIGSIGDASKDIFYGGRNRRVYVTSKAHGIPFLSSSSILKADLSDVKMVSKKLTPNIQEQLLEKDWILISRSGTIGNTAYTNDIHAQKLASEDVIRVVPNNILRAGYMYAFLSSKYGYDLLTQGTFGAVIQHIEPSHVSQIPIPQFPEEFQNKIDAQIKDAAALRVEANKLLEEAKRKVEEFVGGEPERKKSVTVSSQRIFQSFGKRFEANYHISTGSELEDYIKDKFEYKLLGDVCKSISRPEIFKRNYVKNGVMFLGGADIMLATPDSGKYLSRKTPNIDALAVQEDWILIPRSGTIGDVVYTHSEHAQKLVSEHVIRACPNNILSSGYIYAFLSSKVGKALIQRYIFGSVIQHVESPHLSRIPIPLMSEKEMTEIDSSIKKYKDNVGKAIRLERSAIKAVEDEIDSWGK